MYSYNYNCNGVCIHNVSPSQHTHDVFNISFRLNTHSSYLFCLSQQHTSSLSLPVTTQTCLTCTVSFRHNTNTCLAFIISPCQNPTHVLTSLSLYLRHKINVRYPHCLSRSQHSRMLQPLLKERPLLK